MKQFRSVLMPLSVLIANASGFLIYLLIPKLLQPSQFSVFSLAMASSAFLVSMLYEWIRHGVIRFSFVKDEGQAERNRSALGLLYRNAVLITTAGSVIVGLCFDSKLSFWLPIVVGFAASCQALSDGRQAQARARFDTVSFSLAWLLRSMLNLGLTCLGAWYFGSGLAVAVSFGLSNLLTYVAFNDRFALIVPGGPASSFRMALPLVAYGVFIAISSALTSLFPVVIRAAPSQALGLGDVAGLMLAFDIAAKLTAVAGLTVNLIALQPAIAAAEKLGPGGGAAKASEQFSLVLATIAAVAVSAIALTHVFTDVLLPFKYRHILSIVFPYSIATGAVLTFRMYAIDTIFIIAKRSARSIVGPSCTIVAYIALMAIGTLAHLDPILLFSLCPLSAAILGAIAAFIASRQILPFAISKTDTAKIAVASVLLAAPSWLIGGAGHPILSIVGVAIGGALYGAVCLIGNVANIGRYLGFHARLGQA